MANDRSQVKTHRLECIDDNLFASFNPQNEPWSVGGSTTLITIGLTGSTQAPDFVYDAAPDDGPDTTVTASGISLRHTVTR